MRVVDTATNEPGCCALTGTSTGPFLELDRPLGDELAMGGTAYVSLSFLRDLVNQLDPPDPTSVQTELARVTAERDQAREEHYELLQAVGTTLQHGAIVKRGAIELRKPYDRTGRLINHKQGGKRK